MNHRDLLKAPTQSAGNLNDTVTSATIQQWLANLARIHEHTTPPATITKWLENLTVLSGVPLDYLVPDERMLPCESLRFFQVDPRWIYSLIEGAYSVGRVTTSELLHDQVVAQNLYKQVAPNLYNHLVRRSSTALRNEPDLFNFSGFLLRSAIVSGWPSLRVTAYDSNNRILIPPEGLVSGRRITPGILLYLVEGIIDSVTFQEPSEGIHFGLDKKDNQGGIETLTGSKSLRYANVPNSKKTETPPGTSIPDRSGHLGVPTDFRPKQVLKVNALAQSMAAKLREVQGNNKDDGQPHSFTPAEFALEMIEGVEGVTINITPKAGG
jgi:hypothetical protein